MVLHGLLYFFKHNGKSTSIYCCSKNYWHTQKKVHHLFTNSHYLMSLPFFFSRVVIVILVLILFAWSILLIARPILEGKKACSYCTTKINLYVNCHRRGRFCVQLSVETTLKTNALAWWCRFHTIHFFFFFFVTSLALLASVMTWSSFWKRSCHP